MPELNFKITGDDSELKKTLANIAKVAKENGDRISKEVLKSTDVEVKAREKAVKVTQDQKKASDEIVKGAKAEAAAQDKITEAVKKKNAAFDANGRQIRPIQMSNSQDEINAANSGKVGTITSGPVVGSAMNWNKLANEAASYGQAARDAHNAAVTGASASVKSNEDIRKAIRSLKIEAQSYKNIAESTKDSERLAEYNRKLAETQAEIARLRNVGKQGFDELGNKLTVTAGKQEVLNNKLRMYNEALNRAKAPQSFVNLNRKIQDTEIQLGRLKNAGKTGFDEMGNAVSKSTNKVGAAWNGVKSLANILPGVGIAGLIAFAAEPIIEYVKNLEIFKKSAKSIASDTALDSSEYKSAVSSVTALNVSIDDYHKGLLTGKQVVKEYNDGIGKTAGELKNVAEVENFYNSKADKFVEAMYLRAQAQAALIASTDLLADAQKRAANGSTMTDYLKAIGNTSWIGGNFSGLGNVVNDAADFKQSAIEDLNKKGKDALKLFKDLQTSSDKFNKSNGFNFNQDKGSSNGVNSIITQQESLQKRIDEINKEYARKTLTKDEEELEAVRDKFKKIADEAIKFNADKKNRLHLVDTTGLYATRDNAIKDLEYKQTTERTKIDLEKQKQLYSEYEEYKSRVGATEADARYKNEIDTSITYLQKLEAERSKMLEKDPTEMSGPELKRLRDQDERINEAISNQKKSYQDAYSAAVTHEQSLMIIREKYVAYAKELGENLTEAQKNELNKQRDDEIKAANETAFQKTAVYKKLAEQTIIYTKEGLRAEVKAVQNILKGADLDPKVKADIEKYLNELNSKLDLGANQSNNNELEKRKKYLEKALVDPLIAGTEKAEEYRRELIKVQQQIDSMGGGSGKTADMFKGSTAEVANNVSGGLGQLSGSFGELSSSLEGVNDDLAYTIGSIGELMKVGQDAAGAVASFAAGDIIGGVTKTISAVAGLFNIGKKVKEINAAARKEVQDYYDAAIDGEREYQALLRKRELDEVARGKTSYQSIIARLELLKKQSPEIQAAYDKIYKSLQGQEYVSGMGSQHGTWFRKAKTWDIMASLSGSNYDELEKLYTQGKLADQAKKDFEALRALREELKAAGFDVEDLQKQLNEMLTGTSVEGLSDALSDLFENGKLSAADFGDTFENIMRNAVLNSFKLNTIQKAMAPVFDMLSGMFADGKMPGEKEIQDWLTYANGIGSGLGGQFSLINDMLDKLGLGGEGSQSGVTGGQIVGEALKENTANRMLGINQGMYDIMKSDLQQSVQTNTLLSTSGKTSLELLQLGKSKLDALNRIDTNTANTVAELKNAVIELKTIAKNTGGESIDQALRNGGFKN